MGFILRFSKFSFRGAKKRFPSTDCCYNDFRGLLESPVVMQWLTLTAEEISDTLWRGKRRLFAHFDHLSPRIWSFQPISKNASQALLLCCCVMSHVTSFPLIERTHDEMRVFYMWKICTTSCKMRVAHLLAWHDIWFLKWYPWGENKLLYSDNALHLYSYLAILFPLSL